MKSCSKAEKHSRVIDARCVQVICFLYNILDKTHYHSFHVAPGENKFTVRQDAATEKL